LTGFSPSASPLESVEYNLGWNERKSVDLSDEVVKVRIAEVQA